MDKGYVFFKIDIDFKKNNHLFETLASSNEELADVLKEGFVHNKYVFYAGWSASCHGLSVLMPVSNEGDHRATYSKIKAAFEVMGVYIDDQQIGDFDNLRLLEYDPSPLINQAAKPFPPRKKTSQLKPLNEVPKEIIDNGGVYLISDGRYTKVGYCSSSPFKRLGEIQVGNPEPLFVAGVMPGDKDNEEFCRNKLKKAGFAKKNGEWLKGNPARMIKVLDSQGFKVYSNVENN